MSVAGRCPIVMASGRRAPASRRVLRAWTLAALALIAVPAQSIGLDPPTQGPWLTPGCKIYSTRQWRTPQAQCEVPTRAVTGGVIRWDVVIGRVEDFSPTPDRHGAWVYWIEGLGNARALQLEGRSLRRPMRGELVPIRRRSIYYLGMLKIEEELPGLARELRLALLAQSIPAHTVKVPKAVVECEFNFDKTFDPRRNCILPEGASGLGWTFVWDVTGTVIEAPTEAETTRLYRFKALCDGVVLDGVSWRRPRLGAGAIFIVSRTHFAGELPPQPRMPSREELRRLGAEANRSLSFHCAEGP